MNKVKTGIFLILVMALALWGTTMQFNPCEELFGKSVPPAGATIMGIPDALVDMYRNTDNNTTYVVDAQGGVYYSGGYPATNSWTSMGTIPMSQPGTEEPVAIIATGFGAGLRVGIITNIGYSVICGPTLNGCGGVNVHGGASGTGYNPQKATWGQIKGMYR